MNLSLVAPKFYSDNCKYFGFFSEGIESVIDDTYLLSSNSQLSITELDEIEKRSIELNNVLIAKFIQYENNQIDNFYFFQFYLNPLLNFVTQTYFYRLKQLCNFFENFENTKIENIVLFPLDFLFDRPLNTSESLMILNDDLFSSWINSYIYIRNKKKFNNYRILNINTPPGNNNNNNNHLFTLVSSLKKIFNLKSQYEKDLSKIGKLIKINEKTQRELPIIDSVTNDDIDNIFKIFLKISPKSYFNISKKITTISKEPFHRPTFFNGLKIYNDDYRLEISKKFHNGNTIVGVQHGGHNYGSGKFIKFLINELYLCDYFVTWGYQFQHTTTTKVIPFGSRFPLLKKAKKNISNKILWVGTHMNVNPFRIDSNPQPSSFVKYRQNKLNALKEISKNDKFEIFYRPYFTELNSLSDFNYFSNKLSDLKILKKKKLEPCLVNFNLIIIDHPGTLLNYAIANDIPIICFWQKDIFSFNEIADDVFSFFKKNKLLFESISELKIFLENNEDLNVWWDSSEIKLAKLEFINYFAKSILLHEKSC